MYTYSQKYALTEPLGNNAFSWKERIALHGQMPSLTIPKIIDGTVDDVKLGGDIVFEEKDDNGVLRSCTGLENFVRIIQNEGDLGLGSSEKGDQRDPEIIIFDNHNHALYFWIDAVRRGLIDQGFELIHIDEHSDLWENIHAFEIERALEDTRYAWEFTNFSCNVGNYIQPAIQSGLIGSMIRIENEYQIDRFIDYIPHKNSILNLDLDIFAPELDHIEKEKKIRLIQNLLKKVQYVTIATSPFFIDQGYALENLRHILTSLDSSDPLSPKK